jgi:hypothetical protein
MVPLGEGPAFKIHPPPEPKNCRALTPGGRTRRAFHRKQKENPMPVGAGTGQAKQTKVRSSSKTQDAIKLLKADHDEVEALFEQYEKQKKKNGDQKPDLIDKICAALTVHAQIEEEIFYPACEGKVEEDLLKEAYVEHDGAKVLIAEIMGGEPSDEFYDAKVTVLQEQIEYHVEEEEKRLEGLFSQARKAGLDMEALGAQLLARKEELKADIEANGLPAPKLTTMEGAAL